MRGLKAKVAMATKANKRISRGGGGAPLLRNKVISTKDYCRANFRDFLIAGSCFVNGSHSNTILFEQKKSR